MVSVSRKLRGIVSRQSLNEFYCISSTERIQYVKLFEQPTKFSSLHYLISITALDDASNDDNRFT